MATKKNKQKRNNQRKQKQALKHARRRKENRGKKRPSFEMPSPQLDMDKLFPEEDYLFWLAHGANYLSSNYHTGNWTPLFPDLYTGRLYKAEELTQKTLAHYESQGDPEGVQKRVLAWLLTDSSLIWGFRAGMAHKALKAHPGEDPLEMLRKPHVGILWEGFSQVFDSVQGDRNEELNESLDIPSDPGMSDSNGSP